VISRDSSHAAYSVGIDLGTTHCVLSYVALGAEADQVPEPRVLRIPQLTAPGSIEEREQLPSFLYLPHESELTAADKTLPWQQQQSPLVGALARDMGAKTPLRLVSSAKSWLCHGEVDCHSAFLPLNAPEEVDKASPLQASFLYLNHLRQAWDMQFPQAPLIEQLVTITIPASFDPAARDLTVEASQQVGFKHLTLLEEPQAAVYNWVQNSGDGWREQLGVGDIILVVDVGGGTTDLSLVAVTEEEGNLSLNRVAVGDHILLGGDNMDLALAYGLNAKLAQGGTRLQPWQIQAMTHACRDAKEQLLREPDLQSLPIVVPSRGSKLIGGSLRTELTREEVQTSLVEGFFPRVGIEEHPQQQARSALTQRGLPYAQDAAVPRHLAAFLCRQQNAVAELFGDGDQGFIKPTAVLFNGGVFKAQTLEQRLIDVINGWLVAVGAPEAKVLQGSDLDLAVANGAAYYGYVREGHGVRIRGGIASAYYVGVESAMPAVPGMAPPLEALCVAPFGMEEGTGVEIPNREFGLVVGEPVKFRFFGSTVRREDSAGTLLDYWEPEELEELPDIHATLTVAGRNAGDVVPVRLQASVSEVGTLCLEALPVDGKGDGGERWKVEFDVRDQS